MLNVIFLCLSIGIIGLDIVVLIAAWKARREYLADKQITFNQLCTANQRLCALIAMQGYCLDDVEHFAKLVLQPPEPEGCVQANPKLDTETETIV